MAPHESLQPLVDFYLGFSTDHANRLLDEILDFDDQELESHHDYIQWLFPLREPSAAVPGSPVIDDNQVGVFRGNHWLHVRLLAALDRMLAFYGLVRVPTAHGAAVDRGRSYPIRKQAWVTAANHNFLRVTRILKSLRLLGLETHAMAFFQCLRGIYAEEGAVIGSRTFQFWAHAVGARA